MTSVELDDQTAEELVAAATAKGVSVGMFIQSLLGNPSSSQKATQQIRAQKLSATEFLSQVEELSFDGPTLPADFSRADIYFDHD